MSGTSEKHLGLLTGFLSEGEANRPSIIMSWLDYPVDLTSDPTYIGGKAVGLFALPRDWVPEFLVLTIEFCLLWQKHHDTLSVLNVLPDGQKRVVEDFISSVASTQEAPPRTILVRSNSPIEENITTHGCFSSYVVEPMVADVSSAIDRIMTNSNHSPMCIILQPSISPGLVGHMSNERRVSSSKLKWFIESPQDTGVGLNQTYIKAMPAKRNIKEGSLSASTEQDVLRCLSMVAGTLSRTGQGYFHCEWVWSGKKVWIVQRDTATPDAEDNYTFNYINRTEDTNFEFHPEKSGMVHYRSIMSDLWRKLQRPREFDKLGLPTADIYVLPGDVWQAGRSKNYRGMLHDLSKMCKHPVVIRCDIANNVLSEEDLLPTSAPSTDPSKIIAFMEEVAVRFHAKGIAAKDWAFLPAQLIPARASAMVQAYPGGQRFRIDALWGFPDGLLHFPHDTYFYDPTSKRIEQRIRYKGICLLYRNDAWTPCVVTRPYDWESVLAEDEIKTMAEWAMHIANTLNQEIQLMVLARIGGRRGPSACLPFHYTRSSIKPAQTSLYNLPYGVHVITNREELAELFRSGPPSGTSGYVVKPEPGLLRDSDFLREAAQLAARHGMPIFFEGSLLGHAYYVMAETGAFVIPIMLDEPMGKTKTYNKLVRDQIPVIIRRAGGLARVRTLNRDQARVLLSQKVVEEAFELWNSRPENMIEELADMVEVLDALREHSGISPEALASVREDKRKKRGGFEKLIYLEETGIRPLGGQPGKPGYIPLLIDDNVLPVKSAGEEDEYLQILPARDASDLVRLLVPLVPPVDNAIPVKRIVSRDGGIEASGQYSGNHVEIDIRQTRQKVPAAQLELTLDISEEDIQFNG